MAWASTSTWQRCVRRSLRDRRGLGSPPAPVAVFIGGIATTHWWDAKESAARQAMLEALDRCWVQPVMVRTAEGKTVEMCRLADLTTDRPN